MLLLIYHKRGKIHWAKLSQIPPNVVIHGKTFTVPLRLPHLYNIVIQSLYNIIEYSRQTFAALLKTVKV